MCYPSPGPLCDMTARKKLRMAKREHFRTRSDASKEAVKAAQANLDATTSQLYYLKDESTKSLSKKKREKATERLKAGKKLRAEQLALIGLTRDYGDLNHFNEESETKSKSILAGAYLIEEAHKQGLAMDDIARKGGHHDLLYPKAWLRRPIVAAAFTKVPGITKTPKRQVLIDVSKNNDVKSAIDSIQQAHDFCFMGCSRHHEKKEFWDKHCAPGVNALDSVGSEAYNMGFAAALIKAGIHAEAITFLAPNSMKVLRSIFSRQKIAEDYYRQHATNADSAISSNAYSQALGNIVSHLDSLADVHLTENERFEQALAYARSMRKDARRAEDDYSHEAWRQIVIVLKLSNARHRREESFISTPSAGETRR